MSNIKESEQIKTAFLSSAIADTQSTLRALDSKAAVILVILSVPLTKLASIYAALVTLISSDNKWIAGISPIVVSVFAFAWLLSFLSAMLALKAISNPAKHINGNKPNGAYYSGGLFEISFYDTFFPARSVANKSIQEHLDNLPHTIEDHNKEMAFEHMKLVYIRSLKTKRLSSAYNLGLIFVLSGGILWLCSLIYGK